MMINDTSPFKHLAPYESDDRLSEFIGRSNEGNQLRELYKRSSLIVVHGPSGSGKTSIVNCELIGQLNISLDNVIRIRWHKTKAFLEIIEELSNYVDFSKDEIKKLLSLSKIENNKSHLEDIKDLAAAKDSIKHLKNQIEDYRVFDTEGTTNSIIDRFENKKKDKESEVEVLVKKIKGFDDERQNAHNIVSSAFGKLAEKNMSPILFLFDQFEEYFVNRSNCYNEIGSFCQLLLNSHLPVKVIFSLRDDYLGNFSILKSYLLNYDSYKLRIARLDKNECVNIIENLFQQFNIKCDKKLHDQIFEKIYIDKNKEVIELPYLQVALDSIYQNALGEKVYNPEWKINNALPEIEFTKEHLNIGNVKKIIEKLITKSNEQIILKLNNEHQRIYKKLKNQESICLVFLKQYISEDRTKVTTPYTLDKNKKYTLKYNNPFVNLKSDERVILDNIIVNVLYKNRLINIVETKQFIELSHDTLAKIIDSVHLEIELLTQKFELQHSIYVNAGKARSDLLKLGDVKKLKHNSSFTNSIVEYSDINNIVSASKNEFWRKSLNRYHLSLYSALLLFLLILGTLIFTFFNNKDISSGRDDIFEKGLTRENKSYWDKLPQSRKEELESNFISNPLTSLELPIDKDIVDLKSRYSSDEQLIYVQHDSSLFIYSLKFNALAKGGEGETSDYDSLKVTMNAFEPFNIDSKQYVLWSNGTDIAVKGLTMNTVIDCKDKLHNEIIDFEIIKEEDENIRFIGLGKDRNNKKCLFEINLKINQFGDIIRIQTKNLFFNTYSEGIGDFPNSEYILYESKSIRAIGESLCLKAWDKQIDNNGDYSPNYSNGVTSLLYYDSNKLNYLTIEQPNYIDSVEHLSSFHISADSSILISYGDIIQSYKLSESKDSLIFNPSYLVHDNEIGYFETFEIIGSGINSKYLIGGSNSTCSLMGFENSNRARIVSSLKGHQNEIANVSFLFNRNDVFMTQSIDNTIKFWDLRPLDSQGHHIYKGVLNITQIETLGDSIFAGFLVNPKNPNYNHLIANSTDKLGEGYFPESNSSFESSSKSNFTSFKKTNDDIIIGTKYNRQLVSRLKGATDENLGSTIHEFSLVNDSLIFAACRKGIEKVSYSKPLSRIDVFLENESFLSIDCKGDNIAAVTISGKLFVFKDGESPIQDLGIQVSQQQLLRVRFSPTGKYLAMGGQSDELYVYETETLHSKSEPLKLDIQNANGWITDIAWGASDNIIAFSSRDKRVRMFDIENNKSKPTFIINELPITALSFGKLKSGASISVDENIIYTGDIHGTIKEWNIRDNHEEISRRITLGIK